MATVKRTRGANEITKAGTTLDAAAQLRLTEEAEAGYNPASLTRRHSLSGAPDVPTWSTFGSTTRPHRPSGESLTQTPATSAR